MKPQLRILKVILICFLWISQTGFSSANPKIGFLIIAPDRGSIGNKEVVNLVDKFKENYIASLAFIGRSYNGMGGEYSNYIQKAVLELHHQNASEVVVIPLFFSDSNPLLEKIRKHLPAYRMEQKITWAPPMAQSYLAAQILLDRVETISQNPREERLVVIGLGAIDENSEEAIKKEIGLLTDYVNNRHPFKEIQIGVYYNRNAEPKLRKKKNKEVDELAIRAAAKRGRTLLVPFFLGPKFSHEMSLTHWLGKKFNEFNVTFLKEEILPHPNVLLWMKKVANRHLDVDFKKVGIVIMPHGATQPYNDAVDATIDPIRRKYPVEIAYGMGDGKSIEAAVHKLENQGIRNIVFVRMYPMSRHFKNRTDYILGLTRQLPKNSEREIPSQVRTSAVIRSFGGYEESPLSAKILLDRIREISSSPAEETVVILAHGSKKDEDDKIWRMALKKHTDWIQKKQEVPFRNIHGLTLREDWQEKREEALKEVRHLIKEGNKNGRVLLVSDRLYGSGPYKSLLQGLSFELNAKGLARHPNLTEWIRIGIEETIRHKFGRSEEKAEIAKMKPSNSGNSNSALAGKS